MTVLVTGAAGFIGSHLCDLLLARGDEVIGLDDLSTGRVENLETAIRDPRFRFLEGNAADADLLEALIVEADRVLHLAASVGVGLILDAPVASLENNLAMALTVSRLAVRHRRPLLITSSSEVYGRGGTAALAETDDRCVGPTTVARWSYSTAKAAEEALAIGHGTAASVPVTIARMFNTAGPRQSGFHGMVLPRFVDAALTDRDLTVYGDGCQTRCFLHVHDAVEALTTLSDRAGTEPLVVNVGSTEQVRIADLAALVIAETGSSSEIAFVDALSRFGSDFEEPRDRLPDISRIAATIGWRPRRSLRTIVRDTIAQRRRSREAGNRATRRM